MKSIKYGSMQFQKLCARGPARSVRVIDSVTKILNDVRLHQDDALVKYTRKFDKANLSSRQLRVTEREINAAYQDMDPNIVNALKTIIANIERFYKRGLKRQWQIKDEDGSVLGEKCVPLQSVGVYVPSGSAPLVSSVYMTVPLAKIAKVPRIVLMTPPNAEGYVDPYILVVANLLKVDEIYKVGGAQAIAALAFGTKSINKVDKIVGPGNEYVTEAKRQVFGFCDIDMLAGPSEVLVIANNASDARFIKADLLAQAEHHRGLAILVTPSKILADEMKRDMAQGYVIRAANLNQAVHIANLIAPEHLHIIVKNPKTLLTGIKTAGAVFLGPYSPVAIGDYIAGPSHVLPTGGTARFFSGLGIHDFTRRMHFINYTKKSLEKIRAPLEKVCLLEGLKKHLESVLVRLG